MTAVKGVMASSGVGPLVVAGGSGRYEAAIKAPRMASAGLLMCS